MINLSYRRLISLSWSVLLKNSSVSSHTEDNQAAWWFLFLLFCAGPTPIAPEEHNLRSCKPVRCLHYAKGTTHARSDRAVNNEQSEVGSRWQARFGQKPNLRKGVVNVSGLRCIPACGYMDIHKYYTLLQLHSSLEENDLKDVKPCRFEESREETGSRGK